MPTYEYVCPEGHDFEKFHKMADRTRVKCPECGQVSRRKISGGAGLHFKGTGFYITDYGKDGKGPRKVPTESADAKSEPAKSEPAKAEPAKSEPKTERPRTETKPSGKKTAE
jgi:putative FmdB family regulatory protein